LITLAMSAVVAASRATIWSALSDPEQVLHWRPFVTGALPPTPGELTPGRVLRLRCVRAAVPIVLEELALEVSRAPLGAALGSSVRDLLAGSHGSDGGHTQSACHVDETPLVVSLDRFAVRRLAAERLGPGGAARLVHSAKRRGCGELGQEPRAARSG
jgi:hypothetical protein